MNQKELTALFRKLGAKVANISWVLAQVDDEGNILGTIDGLHESVLETDLTGREMRPRNGYESQPGSG